MKSFAEFSLSDHMLKAITDLGYQNPSPIQEQALPILLKGSTDFIGLAATGTGKTAAFAIPMIEQIESSLRAVQTLILCPTRELALQVSGQINLLGKYKGIEALPIYGGASYRDQLQGLRNGLPVVVGTPGRLVDHIGRGTLKLENVKHIILDEADEMISMGFKEDLEKILEAARNEKTQIWLFSATMSREVRRVADHYLKNPQQVQVNKTEVLPSTVTQLYYMAREGNKPEILCKMIDVAVDFYGIIFCQTKSLVTDLTNYLNQRGYRVDCLHGDMNQNARERTMQSFRDRHVKILVCTDVASRGLDVKDITHVINYSLPRELDSYVHRIGRTARSGKAGFAMSLVTPSQKGLVHRLEVITKSKMKEGTIPSRKDVGVSRVAQMLPKFQEEKQTEKALELLDPTWREELIKLTPEQVAARFIAMMNPNLFKELDIQMPGPRARVDSEDGPRRERPRRDRGGGDERPRRGYNNRGGGERSYNLRPERKPRQEGRPFYENIQRPPIESIERRETMERKQSDPLDRKHSDPSEVKKSDPSRRDRGFRKDSTESRERSPRREGRTGGTSGISYSRSSKKSRPSSGSDRSQGSSFSRA